MAGHQELTRHPVPFRAWPRPLLAARRWEHLPTWPPLLPPAFPAVRGAHEARAVLAFSTPSSETPPRSVWEGRRRRVPARAQLSE